MAKGRKKELADGAKNIIVKLEPKQLQRLKELGAVHSMNQSQVIRMIIDNQLI
jgi:hypothetical protein